MSSAPVEPLAPPFLHERDRLLEQLEIVRVVRGIGAVELHPLARRGQAARLERGDVVARELQLGRPLRGKRTPTPLSLMQANILSATK